MLRRMLCLFAFVGIVVASAIGTDLLTDAHHSVEQWLAFVDASDYSGGWQQAGSVSRGSVSQKQQAKAIARVRRPLGQVEQQALKPSTPLIETVELRGDSLFQLLRAAATKVQGDLP